MWHAPQAKKTRSGKAHRLIGSFFAPFVRNLYITVSTQVMLPASTFGKSWRPARQGREHAAVGPHSLALRVVLKPVPIYRRASRHQKRDHLHVVSAPGFGRGIQPTVERPPQGRVLVALVSQT